MLLYSSFFSDPERPEFIIKNETDETIRVKQKNIGKKIILVPKSSTPYTWDDQSIDKKVLNVYTDKNKKSFNIDDIKILGEIDSSNGALIVETLATKYSKEIIIRYLKTAIPTQNLKPVTAFQAFLTKKFSIQYSTITLDIKSIGISVIDSVPKEVSS
jgi:hypothetical protein